MISGMNSTHQNEMSLSQLLEKMTAGYLRALNMGLALKGSKEAAIAYADETTCAGAKAKAQALSRWES